MADWQDLTAVVVSDDSMANPQEILAIEAITITDGDNGGVFLGPDNEGTLMNLEGDGVTGVAGDWSTVIGGVTYNSTASIHEVRTSFYTPNGGTATEMTGGDPVGWLAVLIAENGTDTINVFFPTSGQDLTGWAPGDYVNDPTGANEATIGGGAEMPYSTIHTGLPGTGTGPVCFAEGMKIETKSGPVKVEDLSVGDMLMTFDNGFQPIRFIYASTHVSRNENRPVEFIKGSIGNTDIVRVSQNHRFRLGSLPIENMMPGFDDTFIHAKDLVNGDSVRFDNSGGSITYYHIMLDAHELLYCEGTVSESWQPHKRNLDRDDIKLVESLKKDFPEIEIKNFKNGGAPKLPMINELLN